jgi:hypothetical protein
MKQSVSGGVVAVVIVLVVVAAVFFGYRYISGGPNADTTQQNIEHWKQAREGGQKSGGGSSGGSVPGAAARQSHYTGGTSAPSGSGQ